MEDFAKVRNCIVHSRGRLVKTHKHFKHMTNLCNKNIGLSLTKSESQFRASELIVDLEYCKLAIEASRSLLLKIANSLEDTERKWEEANFSDDQGEYDGFDFED